MQVRSRVKRLNAERLDYELCWNHNLSGACLMASYMLRHALAKHGISAQLVHGKCVGNYHWWLVINDHIVDITATQFGIKNKVFITPKTNTGYVQSKRQSKKFGLWPKQLHPPRHTQFFRTIGATAG